MTQFVTRAVMTLTEEVIRFKNEMKELNSKNEILELKNDIREIKNLLYSLQNKNNHINIDLIKNGTDETKDKEIVGTVTSISINSNNENNNDINITDENNTNNKECNNNDNNGKSNNNNSDNDNNNNISNNSKDDISEVEEVDSDEAKEKLNKLKKVVKETSKDDKNINRNGNDDNDDKGNNNESNNNNKDKDTNKNNNNNNYVEDFLTLQNISNDDIDDSNQIYDQRIKYLYNYYYGDVYNENDIEKIYQKCNRMHKNPLLIISCKNELNNATKKLLKEYKKLPYLYIGQKDLWSVINAYYNRTNIDSKVMQSLIKNFTSVNSSSKSVESRYMKEYTEILNSIENIFKKDITNEDKLKFIINKMNILRLRLQYKDVNYLLSETTIDNIFTFYDVKNYNLQPIIDKLLLKYNDNIYDYEYQMNGQYSFHLNKRSFYNTKK
ncbi:hypothetical protein PIROE2DRAFT_16709 [Piromyces sp. E2]|nr:hypothetical protein PIROE2DRAFT_16709 [Piromyces sp. E2]|eukprot:OUM58111.1 hypothetical protein PIROE2DRAFT_16709 [Piromyces sp. E2]